jgi:hypothetical protein
VPSESINEETRREWRELGFFYHRDDPRTTWLIRGSRSGLLAFGHVLREYSNNPRRRQLSEHDHFGPYSYLEIGTWSAPEISEHWIAGTLEDLERLSGLVEERVLKAKAGNRLSLRKAYAPNASYELTLEMCEDDFDPATADVACW